MEKPLIRYFLTLQFILMATGSGFSQSSYTYQGRKFNPYLDRISLGIGAGLSAYNGELSTFFNPKLQRYYLNPNLGIDLAYRYNEYLSLKGELNIFMLSSDPSSQYQNNNRIFWSFNFDYFLAASVDILPQKRIDGRFSKWNGAVFGGVGQVNFFPQNNMQGGKKTGEYIKNPSDTIPNVIAFASLSVIYPVGGIVKYYIDKNHFISMEGTYRFTRTDFIDALKAGSHPAFDKYFTLQFKYTIVFDSNPRGSLNYGKYLRNSKGIRNQ